VKAGGSDMSNNLRVLLSIRRGAPSNRLFENGPFDSAETKFCRLMRKALGEVVLEDLEKQLCLQ